MKPAFIITIDTEGDNLWGRCPGPPTTANARFLPRFQQLCERYSFKPVYLTTYEMARDPFMIEFGRDVIRRGCGEIGTHPHPWDSPPFERLTSDDNRFHPYMIEYPTRVIRDKVQYLTDLLEDTFGLKMRSHRAGRWAFNITYAQILLEIGYQVDCSVTPFVSWVLKKGCPKGIGGSNFLRYPDVAYFPDTMDMSHSGNLPLLEVPMTIMPRKGGSMRRILPHLFYRNIHAQYWLQRFWPLVWLRPNGSNLEDMLWLIQKRVDAKHTYAEFMLHSSEFMPEGSPIFPDAYSIDKLYNDIEALFEAASNQYVGMTLAEYYAYFRTIR